MLKFVIFRRIASMCSDGMFWATVDYKKLVSKKSGFLNCSEENPSAHCSTSALWLFHHVFPNSLIDDRVKEQECYASSTLLLLFLSGFVGDGKQTLLEPFLVYV